MAILVLRLAAQVTTKSLVKWPKPSRSRFLCTSTALHSDRVDTLANRKISCDPRTPVALRMGDNAPGNVSPICVQTMMRRAVEAQPKDPIVAVKRGGEWIKWTREQYNAESRRVARGFLACGLERQKGVGIMGFNSPEWMMSLFGGIFAGGLSCGKSIGISR
jgi:hypothetical protein